MTTATFSLAELRAAYTALHAGAFTTDPTPNPKRPPQQWRNCQLRLRMRW